jgi:hypothetical protein
MSNNCIQERSIASIRSNVESYKKCRSKNPTTKNFAGKGFKNLPLLEIEPKNIIPPAFHLLHGACSKLFQVIEHDFSPEEENELETYLASINVRRHPATQEFTGMDFKRLLKPTSIFSRDDQNFVFFLTF